MKISLKNYIILIILLILFSTILFLFYFNKPVCQESTKYYIFLNYDDYNKSITGKAVQLETTYLNKQILFNETS